MENTAKQEAIRKAWGVHYAEYIDENGWIESNVGSLGWDKEYFEIIKKDENVYIIRPKMLNGIVTNNSWIRIESDEDLPAENSGLYFVYDGKDVGIARMSTILFRCLTSNEVYSDVTHYQPIVKPEKPIY